MEFCISSLGGNSGNLSANLVAGVFLIGLLVMAFLELSEKDEVWSIIRHRGERRPACGVRSGNVPAAAVAEVGTDRRLAQELGAGYGHTQASRVPPCRE
jgi:hypothetical protein